MSSTLCPMPFVHQHIQPSGEIRFCCASLPFSNIDANNQVFNVNTHSLKESWNGPALRKLRQDLIDGKEPAECSHCWSRENKDHTNGNSMRLAIIKQISLEDIDNRINYAKNNLGHVNEDPFNFQVMYGNLCNLSCKMCTPQYSSNWSKYFQNLGYKTVSQIKLNPRLNLPAEHPEESHYGVTYDWMNENPLMNIFEDYNKSITDLWLMGGEPTIIDSTKKYIDKSILLGHSKNINLGISTNCTNINQNLLDQLQSFKSVTINISLDGMDEICYIQRTPSHWIHIEKNINALILWRDRLKDKKSKINLNIHSVITSLNLHHILDLWVHLDSTYKDLTYSFMPVVGDSENFDINLVTKTVANKQLDRAWALKNTSSKSMQDVLSMFCTLLENNEFSIDDGNIHYQLDQIQKFHPDMDIKKIYSIYYKDSL